MNVFKWRTSNRQDLKFEFVTSNFYGVPVLVLTLVCDFPTESMDSHPH